MGGNVTHGPHTLQPGEVLCSWGQKIKQTPLAEMAQQQEGQSLRSNSLSRSQAAHLWQGKAGSELSLIKIHS